jgi:hypothetical protein
MLLLSIISNFLFSTVSRFLFIFIIFFVHWSFSIVSVDGLKAFVPAY